MLNEIFGTDKMSDLLAKPVFWIMIIGLVALIVIIVYSIKHPAGGKYVLFTILGIGILGITAYSGVQLNYYYSTSGGIYGAITGIFDTNEVEVVSRASYKIKNTELTQVYETNTYSATMTFSEVFELSKDSKYMIYVNDMPCNDVHNASDYITGKYTYTFYDENMNALHTDTLNIKFAFYTNSTYLSISTDGGEESVKYWNYYFAKNSFVISLDKATYKKPTQIGVGSGDTSNYCVVSYFVDGENIGNQVYLPNDKLILMEFTGRTYGWSYNYEPITDGYIVTSNMNISASTLPLYNITFVHNGSEYGSQEIYDGEYIDSNIIKSPETIRTEDSGYLIFDYWSIDGETEVDIYSYEFKEHTTCYAITHIEYDISVLFYNQDMHSATGRSYMCRVGDYVEFTEEEDFVVQYIALGSPDGERITGSGYSIQDNRDIYLVGNYYQTVNFMVDETLFSSIEVMRFHPADFSTIPTKENYEFLGWSLDGNNVINLADINIYKDTTFIAVFENATQHLYLDYNDGNESDVYVLTGIAGETISIPVPTHINGETFLGWHFSDGVGELDAENLTFTFGLGDGYIRALFDRCDVNIICYKMGFYLTYNGETSVYGENNNGSGGNIGGGGNIGTCSVIIDTGCGTSLETNYNDTLQLSGTGVSFWLEDIECDGEYQTTKVDGVITVTFTNCNYINIYVSGNNVRPL